MSEIIKVMNFLCFPEKLSFILLDGVEKALDKPTVDGYGNISSTRATVSIRSFFGAKSK